MNLYDPTEADCHEALAVAFNTVTKRRAAPGSSSLEEVSDALATVVAVCKTYVGNLHQRLRPH